MRLLIVIGAGASFDCWGPELASSEAARVPQAKDLFAFNDPQQKLLYSYRLMGLADVLGERSRHVKAFNIEQELEKLSIIADQQADQHRKTELFKARFYLQNLIHDTTKRTLELTHGHTAYVRMLNNLKAWIYADKGNRYVDIIVFNYDCLIEDAMEQVFGDEWRANHSKLEAYYSGEFLRIYKPHGSINWARTLTWHGAEQPFVAVSDLASDIEISASIEWVEPDYFQFEKGIKTAVPAIAVPFKTKNNFDECPLEMQRAMKAAIAQADALATFGWKGAEKHVSELIEANKNIKAVYVVSPSGKSEINHHKKIPYATTFSNFIFNQERHLSIESLLLRTRPVELGVNEGVLV